MFSVVPLNKSTMLSLHYIHTPTIPAIWRSFIQSLCDRASCSLWKQTHIGRQRIWEWKWKFQHTHSSQMNPQNPPCFQWWKHLLWSPTPHSTATSQSHCKPVWCQLSFSTSDDEESSVVDIPSTYSTVAPQNPMCFAQQPHSKSIYTICDDLEQDKEEGGFPNSITR